MPSFTSINRGLDRAATVYETALMISEITVRPPSVNGVDENFNEATGEWTSTPPATVYEGIAHIRQGQARPIKTVEIGESLNAVREWRLRVPRGTVSFEPGSVVEIVDADRTPEMIGQKFRIDDWPEGSLTPTPLYMMTAYHPRDHRVP